MNNKIIKRIIVVFFSGLYLFFLVFKLIVTLENTDFIDINARNAIKIEDVIRMKRDYSFIAVGNVMNSDIFRYKMLPLINKSDADFVVFTGNFLMDGNNDKYAALNRMLENLQKPAIFVFGDREASDRGSGHFFRHIGNPYFFFTAGDSLFIIMDTTGFTGESTQLEWMSELLNNFGSISRRFVFANRSLILNNEWVLSGESNYTMSESYIKKLRDLFSSTGVNAVVSSSGGPPDISTKEETAYIASGGGGGVYNDRKSGGFYCTQIDVSGKVVTAKTLPLLVTKPLPGATLFTWTWDKIYSWVHVAFLNIILIISLLFFIVYRLYARLIINVDYYPHPGPAPDKKGPLTIAMFTNNYLPFIGGVPISIARLKKGLENEGHQVFIFAPAYKDTHIEEEESIIRFSPLFHYRKGKLIVPVSNIFSWKIKREFKRINPDIVHVHHPFWLGSVGKNLAIRYRKPVVFTYHTRLEQYNHYVPFFRRLAGGQIPHMMIKFFASACDAVIAPTSSAKGYLRNLGIGKLIIVQPTGVELKEPPPVPEVMNRPGYKILFSVFRLSKEKNPFLMLEGIKRLSKTAKSPFICIIAGTGPEEAVMKAYIKEHDIEDYVSLIGKVSPEEIQGYYSGADLFIFTSQSETQGMVILEAMAGKTPVVAVDSSGISDIVENGVNGFKTEADLEEWTDKILTLLGDIDLHKRMSEQALLTAHKNSLSVMCSNITDMYYEIIDWKKKHPDNVFIR